MTDLSEWEAREIVDRVEALFEELTALKMLPPEAVAAEMMALGYGYIFHQDIVNARHQCADVLAKVRGAVSKHVNRAERRAGKHFTQ